ncbi:MAG: hypothetical protein ACOCSD_08395 [Halolamina sp.]
MVDPQHDDGARLDLADEEQWVLHAALLDHLDRRTNESAGATGGDLPAPVTDDEGAADEAPANAIALLEALEDDEPICLDRAGLLLVRERLSEYLAGAPLRDRSTCRSVLADVRDEL